MESKREVRVRVAPAASFEGNEKVIIYRMIHQLLIG